MCVREVGRAVTRGARPEGWLIPVRKDLTSPVKQKLSAAQRTGKCRSLV